MNHKDYAAFAALVQEQHPSVYMYAYNYQTKKPKILNFYIRLPLDTAFIINFDCHHDDNKWTYNFIPVYQQEDTGDRDFYCEVACFFKDEWLEFIADVQKVIIFADGILELLEVVK